jgi:hypothetical protein
MRYKIAGIIIAGFLYVTTMGTGLGEEQHRCIGVLARGWDTGSGLSRCPRVI